MKIFIFHTGFMRFIIPDLTNVVEMAERLDTKSSMNLSGFRSQLEAFSLSSHTEEL